MRAASTRDAGASLTAQTIREVTISGAKRITAETIRATLLLKPGEPYDAAKADESIRALFATGHFQDVSLRQDGRTLRVTVAENPIIERIVFEGNAEVETATLEAAIKVKATEPYTAARANEAGIAIRDLYRSKGRLGTTVLPRSALKGDGRVDLVFAITESKVDKVSAIRFEGDAAMTHGELSSVIRTTESSWLDILKSDAFYDPARLDIDRELLLQHYRKSGYADAKVISAEGVLDETGTGYIVTYTIDAGPRFTISEIAIETGASGVDRAPLQDRVRANPGDNYDATLLDRSTREMTEALLESGRPFTRIRPKEERDVAARTVRITYVVEESPPAYIERVDITGNTKTKDYVIRRTLRFAEGDAFHPFLLERARERLKALGFFSSVQVATEKGSADDKLAVAIAVVEAETRIIGAGIGYSQNDGVIGDISIEERNLMGNGQWAKLKLAGGIRRFEAEASFTEPRFLGSDVAAGADLFYKDIDRTRESSYKSQRAGGAVRLGYALTDEWSAGVKYMATRSTLYDVGPEASRAIKEAAGIEGGSYDTSAIGFSATYDDRDSKRLPTKGTILSLGQDFAGVGGDVRYIRTTADLRTYYAVSDDITLAARAQSGFITGWGGQDVRLLDLFYKGNDLVRGFASSGLGPRDTLSPNQDALGGTTYYGTSLAAQFNLPLIPKDIGLRGEIFADAGSLFGLNNTAAGLSGAAGGKSSMRVSVGAGLIWDSPIGPLRADYALPVVSQAFDKTQPFSFGIGQF